MKITYNENTSAFPREGNFYLIIVNLKTTPHRTNRRINYEIN